MAFALPSHSLSQLPEDTQAKLRYVRVCTLGIWLCAVGRWVEGNRLGAANDLFSTAFGTCIFQEDLPSVFHIPHSGGMQCLFPFALLSGINACFDVLTLIAICPECFNNFVVACTTECSGCFFTLGAALFQTSGSVLSWQIHRAASRDLYSYSAIGSVQQAVQHATDLAEEGQAKIGVRTGIGGLSAGRAASAREILGPSLGGGGGGGARAADRAGAAAEAAPAPAGRGGRPAPGSARAAAAVPARWWGGGRAWSLSPE